MLFAFITYSTAAPLLGGLAEIGGMGNGFGGLGNMGGSIANNVMKSDSVGQNKQSGEQPDPA